MRPRGCLVLVSPSYRLHLVSIRILITRLDHYLRFGQRWSDELPPFSQIWFERRRIRCRACPRPNDRGITYERYRSPWTTVQRPSHEARRCRSFLAIPHCSA